MKFKQKIPLITGAVGDVGQALPQPFTREGARLMFSGCDQAGCARIAKQAHAFGFEVSLAGDLRQ